MGGRAGWLWIGLAAVWLSGCCAGGSRQESQERVLRTNLATLRALIGQLRDDTGVGPLELEALVAAGYLRIVPYDPITQRNDSWIAVREPEPPHAILDVRSGASGTACDGSSYASW